MPKKNNFQTNTLKFSGFTLVELMVSLVISAIILTGVVQVVLSSKQSYQSNLEISFIQENARFVIDMMTRDIRMAGYRGCATGAESIANTFTTDLEGFLSPIGVMGYNGGSAHPSFNGDITDSIAQNVVDGQADSIIIRRGEYENEFELNQHLRDTRTLTLWESADFEAGAPLVIADRDCKSAAFFLAGSVSENNVVYSIAAGCSNTIRGDFDCTGASIESPKAVKSFGNAYFSGSRVMRYIANAYYIADSSAAPGVPALKRQVLSSSGLSTFTEELAIGVEDLQIEYGFDSNNDARADRFVAANNTLFSSLEEWQKVVAVKIDITFRSETPVNANSENISFQGQDSTDGYMRQLITTTINIRNNKGRVL